jgi:hypothetical protein
LLGWSPFAGPAQAVPPQAASGSFDLLGTDTEGSNGYCSFPVTVDFVNNQLTPRPQNRLTGFISVTVTNTDTGKSLKFNASGPGIVTVADDPDGGSITTDGTGPWFTWTTVENTEPAGVLPLAYTTGRLHYVVDANGNTIEYELTGKSQDVCALLA